MDPSSIRSVLQALNLNENDVTNIYHHGSWVYGTNSPTSDRDLVIVTHSFNQKPLEFWSDFDYFHEHQSYKLWNQYDINIYTVENFELLLEKTFLIAVQCVFLPEEFKIKEEIDFRKIYLEKYFNPFKLKQSAFYEMYRYWKLYKPENSSLLLDEERLSRRAYFSKRLFHGLRYLDFVHQIIQTQSIHDYRRVSDLLGQIKYIRDNPIDHSSMERVTEFVRTKEAEFKSRLDAIVPTNIIKGTFEVQITFDCTQNTEQLIENLKKICESTKYQILYIQLNENKSQQIIIFSDYDGEYPSIVQQVEKDADQYFQDCNIMRIKIGTSALNTGVPETDTEKKLFWDRTTNYFEFYYDIPLEKDRRGEKFKKMLNTNRSKHRMSSKHMDFSRIEIQELDKKNSDYIFTMRLFVVGREKSSFINNEIFQDATQTIKHHFIVYDRDFPCKT